MVTDEIILVFLGGGGEKIVFLAVSVIAVCVCVYWGSLAPSSIFVWWLGGCVCLWGW